MVRGGDRVADVETVGAAAGLQRDVREPELGNRLVQKALLLGAGLDQRDGPLGLGQRNRQAGQARAAAADTEAAIAATATDTLGEQAVGLGALGKDLTRAVDADQSTIATPTAGSAPSRAARR